MWAYERERDRETERGRQTDRQKDRERERQTDRERDRQTDRQTGTETAPPLTSRRTPQDWGVRGYTVSLSWCHASVLSSILLIYCLFVYILPWSEFQTISYYKD